MLCAISGEAPQDAVASKKSGHVFERRLIETYIDENGRDPINQEELTKDDLISLQSADVSRPRPPTVTSIPSLLSAFQNEWDALALEIFNLRQQLQQTRQELSTALYQNDAAVRIVARLTRERDEAREALSKIGINGTTNGEAMQVDGTGLSAELVAKVDATHEKLSKTRRKRALPEEWATAATVEAFKAKTLSREHRPDPHALALGTNDDTALIGARPETLELFSISKKKTVEKLETDNGVVSATSFADLRAVGGTSVGGVHVFDAGEKLCSFTRHAGAATAVSTHPCGDIVASVSADKSFAFYDLSSQSVALQIFTDSALQAGAFHPDGHIFAAGGTDGKIKVFDVKTGEPAAEFDGAAPVQSLAFSENGTWLAVACQGETSVQIWDLRKAAQIKSLEVGGAVSNLAWDYTGQFLAAVGPGGMSVCQYTKASKEWSTPLQVAVPGVAVQWGPRAESLVVLGTDGSLTALT